jgi:hypothetical protein
MQTQAAASMPLPVPAGPAGLTAEWLTAALRTRAPGSPAVTQIEWQTVGAGLGFAGEVVRIRPHYESSAGGPPDTLIGKFASPVDSARALLNDFGAYEREVHFYTRIAGDAGLPAPACYYAGYDPHAGSVVLLLEDLAQARLGDQVAGATPEEAEFVVAQLARFHAKRWNDAALLEQPWLRPNVEIAGKLPELFDRGLVPLRETLAGSFDGVLDLLQRLIPVVSELAEAFGDRFPPKPFTLVHGDMRMDNLFLPSRGEGRFAVVDWQGAAIGSPAEELAYFMILSLPVETRRRHEASLLALYHATLAANGVRSYPQKSLERDYSRAILIQLVGLPVLVSNLDFRSERGQALVTVALERISAAASDLKAARLIGILTWVLRFQRLSRSLRRRASFVRRRRIAAPAADS